METINLKKLCPQISRYKYCLLQKDFINADDAKDKIDEILKDLPNGSGIDNGIELDIEKSNKNKVVFTFGYHHLNENGYYDGWTAHKLILIPEFSFSGINIKITGRNRNNVKEYLHDTFNDLFTII